MARIVLTTWGSYGDLYPYIGLGIELRRRGHQPVLAMPPLYREHVEREQLEFAPVRPDIDINDREMAARAMDPARGPEAVFGEMIVPHLADTYTDLSRAVDGADLIVSHPATPIAPIVAEERRLRWASSVLAPMSFFSAYDPPTPPPAPWIQPWLTRSLTISRAFLWLTDRITRGWAEPIQRFRVSRGLPRSANPILAGQHSPHLVLAMFSPVLANAQPDWPANVCVTGASMYNAEQQTPLPPDLLAFLDAGPPPVVFTLGTSAIATAGRFYDVSAEVVDRLSLRAVLLIGHHAQNRPARVSDRVFIAEFAPHAPLFAGAAAVVHQGGAGTLHQALATGKPMIVVPHSHDQPDNARRVTQLGVARTVFPQRYTAAALVRELTTVMTPAYVERAKEIGRMVRKENGPRAASDAIERLLGS
jgi:UDP:flavonoid glycosyltransferase YjiC (YdhE family)